MRRALVLLVALAGVASGCSSSRAGPVARIGLLYPTAGPQGAQGRAEQRGVELAAEWANDHGGVGGRRLRLVAAPADRAEAVPPAMESLRRKGVSVVVGSHGSAVSATAARMATDRGMLLWETGAVGQTDGDVAGASHFIRMAPMGANLGRAAIDFVADQLAPKLGATRPLRYAVAYVDDPYGRAVGLGALDEIGGRAEPLAGTFPYAATGTDFAALAGRIAASSPDVLFVSAYLEDGVALRRALVAARVPLLASVGTSSSYCLPAFGERLGPDAVGLFASDKPDAADVRADLLSPEGRAALEWGRSRYQDRYGEPMDAPALSGFANALALFSHVLPAARRLDPAAVASAALSTKLPEGSLPNAGGLDIAGPGTPDAGANRRPANVIWEWVAPGQRAVVWPPAFANHPLLALPLAR